MPWANVVELAKERTLSEAVVLALSFSGKICTGLLPVSSLSLLGCVSVPVSLGVNVFQPLGNEGGAKANIAAE